MKAWHAPGRVNLIGEHTDYNEGFVMPIAIGLGCTVSSTPSPNAEILVTSAQMNDAKSVALTEIPSLQPAKHWSDYVFGVAKELRAAGFDLAGAHLHIDSTVPTGSGLSSSAALEVASALALLHGRSMDGIELARLCQRAERNFVGMPCGIMDQYTSVFGERHAALMLDCRTQTHTRVPLPDGIEIIAVNTMVKHELGTSAYRERVAQCQEALSHFPGRKALRDVTLADLERAAAGIPEIPLARARHVIIEDWRVEQFLAAATALDLNRMGRLFVESHRSLQHDYEVSCEELDYLVDTALTLDGVFGARMTGGGFGGCTVNLVSASAADAFEREISARYQAQYQIAPSIYRCVPSQGAGPVA